jgi:hypothetical protein
MRRLMFAAVVALAGWIGVSSVVCAEDSASTRRSQPIKAQASETGSTVFLAANFQSPEIIPSSPSDRVPAAAVPVPAGSSQSISPFQLPYAPGPSGVSFLLKYMSCDPHSCPNIWGGYEAQRAAELAAKCAPPGCGCKGLQLYPSPCTTCVADSCSKPVNRYRQTVPSSPCGCDSCNHPSEGGLPCASCQASKSNIPDVRAAAADMAPVAR